MYYLQSRYYDANICRFINADGFVSTGQGLLGYNMYAYCQNNPVMYVDLTGCFLQHMLKKLCLPVTPIRFDMIWRVKKYRSDLRSQNYANNSVLDNDPSTTTKNKIIDYQGNETTNRFMFGRYGMGWNGCETIAVHNARVLLGLDSTLTDTIDTFNRTHAGIGMSGYFGGNPLKIGSVLSEYNMDYTRVSYDQMTEPGVYIFSYWTSSPTIHTVAVYYDGTTYAPYNKTNGYLNPYDYSNGTFISCYYLGG